MKFLKILIGVLAAVVISFAFSFGAAEAASGEPVAVLAFSDSTRYYKIPSAKILSGLMAEKIADSGKFTLKEPRPIDFADPGADNVGISTEILREISKKYGANFIITGKIKRIEAVHKVFHDVGNAASVAGTVADIFGGGILGSVLGAFGGAGTTKDVIAVAADVSIINTADGSAIWEKELAAAENVGKYPGNMVTTAGGITADENIVKVMDSLADSAIKTIIEEVGANRLIVK